MGVLHGVVENTYGLLFAFPHSFDINGYGLVFSVGMKNSVIYLFNYLSRLSSSNRSTLTCLLKCVLSFKIH